MMKKRLIGGVLMLFLVFECCGALSPQLVSNIRTALHDAPMFRDLPLDEIPEDIAPYWESLFFLYMTPYRTFRERRSAGEQALAPPLRELQAMNEVLADAREQEIYGNQVTRRAFAVKYCHLVFFIQRFLFEMKLNPVPFNQDPTWQVNLAKMRDWLGAKPFQANSGGGAMSGNGQNAQFVRSVRDIEQDIRDQERYLSDLKRQRERADSDYASYESSERRRVAEGGRIRPAYLMTGKLQTIHNMDQRVRDQEQHIDRLRDELEIARQREESQKSDTKESRSASGVASDAAASPSAGMMPSGASHSEGSSFWKITTCLLLVFVFGGSLYRRRNSPAILFVIRRVRQWLKNLEERTRP